MSERLLDWLRQERDANYRGGIYKLTQIALAYNSNKIEGSRLTEDQTRDIFETGYVTTTDKEEPVRANDVVEMVNHFFMFNNMLSTADEPLSAEAIKSYHRILKSNTSDALNKRFAVGEYKQYENTVAGIVTSSPADVASDMDKLISEYNAIGSSREYSLRDIADFHVKFERIHPFQDGNGRVGRLIIFKECLKNDIVPSYIDETNRALYYQGLREWDANESYLINTLTDGQESYECYIGKYTDIGSRST
jgi:Fic family protein